MVGRSFPAFSSPAQSRVAYFRLVLSGTLLTDLRNAILSLICCVLLHLTRLNVLLSVALSLLRRLGSPRLPRSACPALPALRGVASLGLPHSARSLALSALPYLTPCAHRRVLCLSSWTRCTWFRLSRVRLRLMVRRNDDTACCNLGPALTTDWSNTMVHIKLVTLAERMQDRLRWAYSWGGLTHRV